MRINVNQILDDGLFLEFEEKAETFPVLAEIIQSGEYEFLAPLKTSVRAIRVRDIVEVEGSIETRIRLNCSRCLKLFEMPLSSRFALTYTQHLPESAEAEVEEGLELSADEMRTILFHGDEIDLREALQEQIVMAFPLQPLCSPGCKGLCPQCGADLNEGECSCQRDFANSKFAALKDLKLGK